MIKTDHKNPPILKNSSCNNNNNKKRKRKILRKLKKKFIRKNKIVPEVKLIKKVFPRIIICLKMLNSSKH